MAGHSKWKTIKHKKAKEDAKRGKAFTKLIKEITVAARAGGGNPDHNARLRRLLDKAKDINMPLENATRAIKKGTGELPGVSYESFIYEGFGPHGIAIMIETLTDNKNRMVAELRHLFSKHHGNLAESGAVSWMFENLGVIRASGVVTEEQLMEHLLDYDITNISYFQNIFSISCNPKSLDKIRKAVEQLGLKIESAEIEWVAKTNLDLSDNETKKAYDFLNVLDDHDDVQNVYTNLA